MISFSFEELNQNVSSKHCFLFKVFQTKQNKTKNTNHDKNNKQHDKQKRQKTNKKTQKNKTTKINVKTKSNNIQNNKNMIKQKTQITTKCKKTSNNVKKLLHYIHCVSDSLFCTTADQLTKSMPQIVDNCKQPQCTAICFCIYNKHLISISIRDGKY